MKQGKEKYADDPSEWLNHVQINHSRLDCHLLEKTFNSISKQLLAQSIDMANIMLSLYSDQPLILAALAYHEVHSNPNSILYKDLPPNSLKMIKSASALIDIEKTFDVSNQKSNQHNTCV